MIGCWRKGLATLMVDMVYLRQPLISSLQVAAMHILHYHRLRITTVDLIPPRLKTTMLSRTQITITIIHNPIHLISRDHSLANQNLNQPLLKLHTSKPPHPRRHTSNIINTVALLRKLSPSFNPPNHPNLPLRRVN